MRKTIKQADPTWDLKLLYRSATDPQIERDVRKIEALYDSFSVKYDTKEHEYLANPNILLDAIHHIEKMYALGQKPLMYFWYLRDIEAENKAALSNIPLLENRLTKALNKTTFFFVLLGRIPTGKQKQFLTDEGLVGYRVFLQRVFDDAKHNLSIVEEKIMSLKSQPAYDMWIAGNEKVLKMQTVIWKGKILPIAQAANMVRDLKSGKERSALAQEITKILKHKVAPFSEAEINAVVTNKKISDELRGYKTSYEDTVLGYRNDPKAVESLISAVRRGYPIAQRFYRVKAKLLKQKRLTYADRSAKIGSVNAKFSFTDSVRVLKKALSALDPKYPKMLDGYLTNGQVDVPPRIGKTGGAYCSGSYGMPTFVLLNHTGDLGSYTTLAHEMGHAFHTELSKSQGPLYANYSISLAETASTLFESIALEAIYDSLSDKEKIIVLHDRIQDAVSTIFRQIACFSFEKDIHETVRTKGYVSKEELADLHNKHMQEYMGPIFKLERDDGYFFVQWSHIRKFFYVYTYAYGLLVSNALLRRYKADPTFWVKIEQFLSAGGKDSPENILKEIGIDVSKPGFWQEGLKAVESDIAKLEKLV